MVGMLIEILYYSLAANHLYYLFQLSILSLDRKRLCRDLNNFVAILIIQTITDPADSLDPLGMSELFSECEYVTIYRPWIVDIDIPGAFE